MVEPVGKAALPAMVTGLCVYIAVIALSAALEPESLKQGVVIKIIAIGVLISGIKAALQERDEREARRQHRGHVAEQLHVVRGDPLVEH